MALDTPQLTTSTEELKMMRDTWDRDLLERAKYELVHALFGSTAYVPAQSDAPSGGSAYKWFRPEPIVIAAAQLLSSTLIQAAYSANTQAQHDTGSGGYQLTQGNDPTASGGEAIAKTFTISTVVGTPDEYGAYYVGSKRLKRSGFFDTRDIVTSLLGQNMGEVMDMIARNQLVGGSNIQYAGTATSTATVAPDHLLNFAEIIEASKTLQNNKARPLRNSHNVAIITPETWATLMLDRQFQEHIIYGGKDTMFTGGLKGRIEWAGLEFYVTPVGFRQTGALTTVHSTFIVAADSYGQLKLRDMGATNIFHDVGSAGTLDPMNQRWTQGWTANLLTKILNNNWFIELQHAVAA
jgi:N4-gp56 family major capsid protein